MSYQPSCPASAPFSDASASRTHTLTNVSGGTGTGTGTGTGLITASNGTSNVIGAFTTTAGVGASGGTLNFGGISTAGGLTLSGGAIGGTGSLTVNGPSTWTGGRFADAGSTTLNGNVTLSGSANRQVAARTVTFAGTSTWSGTGDFFTGSGASLVNTGSWLDQTASSVSISNALLGGAASSFTNEGTYTKSGASTTTFSIAFLNPGIIDVQSGVLQLPSSFENAGTIHGNGTVQVSTLRNAGHVAPGSSIGTLTVTGSYLQLPTGWLDTELTTATDHDLLQVTGTATLGGTLNIACLGTCSFTAGQSLTILDAASLVGTFSNVVYTGFATDAFDVVYDVAAGDVRLIAQAVPEPTTWALWGAGLFGLAAARRGRRASPDLL